MGSVSFLFEKSDGRLLKRMPTKSREIGKKYGGGAKGVKNIKLKFYTLKGFDYCGKHVFLVVHSQMVSKA